VKKSDRSQWAVLIGAAVVLEGLFVAARQRGANLLPARSGFGEMSLPTVGGGEAASLSSCPTARCLTVYLAPWCGVCRASTDLVKALRPWLAERGIATRIVIGRDRPAEVRDYASSFGPDTLMDPEGTVPLKGGVPQFLVSNGEGAILRSQPGVLRIVSPPIPESELEALSRALGLI